MNRTLLCSLLLILTSAVQASNNPGYHLDVEIDPSAKMLRATARIIGAPASSFYLNRHLVVREVLVDGTSTSFRTDDAAASLPFSPESALILVAAAPRRELLVRYDGRLENLIFGVNQIDPTLVELANYSTWYPILERIGCCFTYELEISLPRQFRVTTNGKLISSLSGQKRTKTSWRSFSAVGDIVLLASPKLQQVAKMGKGGGTEILYRRMSMASARSQAADLSRAYTRIVNLLGGSSVEGVTRLAYTPRSGWGYSRIPLIVVSEERALETLALPEGEAKNFRANVHEMAHFWWMIADPATPNDWLNEGLAEFTAYRVTTERFGRAFGEMRLSEYRSNVLRRKTKTSIAETEGSSPDREVNRYDRATLMLVDAERRFGSSALNRLLRGMFQRFGTSHGASTRLFLEEVEKQIGKAAREYFYAELYSH
jgi:hypothetical protein